MNEKPPHASKNLTAKQACKNENPPNIRTHFPPILYSLRYPVHFESIFSGPMAPQRGLVEVRAARGEQQESKPSHFALLRVVLLETLARDDFIFLSLDIRIPNTSSVRCSRPHSRQAVIYLSQFSRKISMNPRSIPRVIDACALWCCCERTPRRILTWSSDTDIRRHTTC